jgi:hypothetical protein
VKAPRRINTFAKAITFVFLAAFGTWAIYSGLAWLAIPGLTSVSGYFACWALSSSIGRGCGRHHRF